MGQSLFRPKDERGVPRRFRSHGEAFGWVAGSLAKMYGPRILGGSITAVAAWLAWSVARSVFSRLTFDPFPPGWPFVVTGILATLLVL